jgi:hypothetical protein
MRNLLPLVILLAGCTTDFAVMGPDDPFWDDGYTHDDLGDEEELGQLGAPTQSVYAAATTGACTTAVVRGLAEQLVEEVECMQPGTMARIDQLPGVTVGASIFPFLQKPVADALRGVAAARPLTINSALRTVVQQFVLYTWYTRGRCTNVVSLAAPPGRSNHESGLAIDVSDPSGAKASLTARGFRWLGSTDPVHYDYVAGGLDLRSRSVLAFQRLWNRNHPGEAISEDGSWGPQTEGKVKQAPSAGFPIGSSCGAGVGVTPYAIDVSWTRNLDGSYTFAATADPRVTRFEYRVDGTLISSTYTFSVERTERALEVRGFDASGTLVGHGIALLDVTADTGVFIREVGRRNYEIGLERAPADVAAIEVRADGFLITDELSATTRSTRGAVRSMFNQLGARTFEITTYGADGEVRGTLRRTFALE